MNDPKLISKRVSRITKTTVSIFQTPTDFVTKCDEHGTEERFKTRRQAISYAPALVEWCALCNKRLTK